MSKSIQPDTAERRRVERRQRRIAERERVELSPRKTKLTSVASPTVPGARDRVEQVIDTVYAMLRRRQIGDREWRAAETYRRAYDGLSGRLGNTMDPDRVCGASGVGRVPAPHELIAAGKLNAASKVLGLIDGRVVEMIVGEGRSIEETAHMICGPDRKLGQANTRDCDRIGSRLRMGLGLLADLWHPEARSKMRMYRPDDARPIDSGAAGVRDIEVQASTYQARVWHRRGRL